MRIDNKNWQILRVPEIHRLPRPVYFRSNSMPDKSIYVSHKHIWNQLVYASQGVLTVTAGNNTYTITSEQAVWIPAKMEHSTYSYGGATFKSIYVESAASDFAQALPKETKVIVVSSLLKELILESATFDEEYDKNGYQGRVIQVLLELVTNMPEVGLLLPWPQTRKLQKVCETLHQTPSDSRTMEQWGRELNTSSRTLARHFESETGLSIREWRRRLRLIKALEYLGEGDQVTQASLRLGYNSTSSFIHAFKQEYGSTPLRFIQDKGIRT